MTEASIIDAAQAIYSEETGDFISETYLKARYNEAKRRIERRTRCYPIAATSNLTTDRTKILPAGLFAIRRHGLHISGAGPILPIEWPELVVTYPLTWNTVTAAYPDRYYLEPATVTASGVTNWGIGFYPTASALVTDGVTIYGWGISDDPNLDTISPPWPTPFHFILVWELCVMAATRDMDWEMKNSKAISHFKSELATMETELRGASSDFGVTGKILQMGEGAEGYDDEDQAEILVYQV